MGPQTPLKQLVDMWLSPFESEQKGSEDDGLIAVCISNDKIGDPTRICRDLLWNETRLYLVIVQLEIDWRFYGTVPFHDQDFMRNNVFLLS